MCQVSMFEEESLFPSSYEEIEQLYKTHIYDGEKDEIAFSWKDKKDGRSYFFYGDKVFAFYPDNGKGPKFMICETVGDKKKEIPVNPQDFMETIEKLKKRYQYLSRNTITETFACCNDFKRCSAVDACLHPKEIFYNGCYYRSNLEAGRNFYKEAQSVDTDVEYKYILGLDYETANASRSSACAVAAVKYDLSGNEIDSFYTLINPEQPFDSFNIMIHGITPDMVKDAPLIDEAMQKVFLLIDKDTLVVCHNSAFDMSVLRNSLTKNPIPIPDFAFTCTYRLASRVLPKNVSYSLPDVAEQCGISDLIHHDAKSDASTCAKILIHLYHMFDDNFMKLHITANLKFGHFVDGEYDGVHKSSSEATKRSTAAQYSINIEELKPDPESPFYGKIVSFTGKLESMTRSEAIAIINAIGGVGSDNMTQKTNILVTGYQDPRLLAGKEKSSKRIMAEQMLAGGKSIEIISEDDFLKML